jgi:hypothetical protein
VRQFTVALLALVVLAACDRTRDVATTGPTTSQGIVLERVELEEERAPDRCSVKGTIRNDSGAGHRVTLDIHAFNGRGDDVAFARPIVDFVAAGARSTFEARLRDLSDDGFLNDCDRVARVELLSVQLQ